METFFGNVSISVIQKIILGS